jgi:predicted XRE-type DNA-binding protein
MRPEDLTIHALRSDLALQIAREVERSAQTQVAAAKRLAVPQPTLSKIRHGRVEDLSLELLLRIAARAGLPVVLQTGREPAEAGVYVSGIAPAQPARTKSRLAEEARHAQDEHARHLTPRQRLEAHAKHNELVHALQRAGQTPHKTERP